MRADRSQCIMVIINPKRVTLTAYFVNSDNDTNDINEISVTAFEIADRVKIVAFCEADIIKIM